MNVQKLLMSAATVIVTMAIVNRVEPLRNIVNG